MEWIYEGNPIEPGWYPIVKCYDEEEGVFSSSAYWTGTAWQNDDPVIAFGSRCATKAEADHLADEDEHSDHKSV